MKIKLVAVLSAMLISAGAFADEFIDTGMKTFPAGTFVIGEESQTYTAKRYVEPFELAEVETTYRLWFEVRIWAEKNGYVFQNPGQEGSEGLRGKLPTQENKYHPVTMITWYDAVVWCNAYSEKNGLTPCYSYEGNVLRDSTDTASCDLSVCNWKADGYRLPSETEWEYAARFNGKTFDSGAEVSGGNEDAVWYYANSKGTHPVAIAGTPFKDNAPPSPGSGIANKSGLFDMSGNVLEYCWDWLADYEEVPGKERACGPDYGAERVSRGGSWNEYTLFLSSGDRYSFDPNEAYNYFGFRVCRSLGL